MQTYPIAKINLAALRYNLLRVKQLAPQSQIMSVIKANAYGHGAVEVAKALTESDAFAVARISEAMQLRDAGIQHPIVVLDGVSSECDLQLAAKYGLSLVFHHETQIECVISATLQQPLNFCWLMVETGMHRLGLAMDKLNDALSTLENCANISGEIGLMSHFANADSVGDSRNQQQLDRLHQFSIGTHLPISMANSAAILSLPESHGNWLRPGLMLYGISPFENQLAQELDLKPVMQLSSILTSIQSLNIGDQVGYAGAWTAQQATRIGVVSIGYGDGYSRQLSNTGLVLINDQRVAVLGRVSMDMIAIDLSHCDDALIGDEVILWGHELLSVETIAEKANTIAYELVCQVSERVMREYHNG